MVLHTNSDMFTHVPVGPDPVFNVEELLCFIVGESAVQVVFLSLAHE